MVADDLQWSNEITRHCKKDSETPYGLGLVIMHRAGNRVHDVDTLQRADVVLTTYSEVNRSYPKGEPPDDLTTAEQKVCKPSNDLAIARIVPQNADRVMTARVVAQLLH